MDNDEKILARLNDKEKKKILDTTKELQDYLDKNPNATKKDIEKKYNQSREIIDPLIEKADSQANLFDYANGLKKRINNDNDILSKLSKKEKRVIESQADEALDWLEEKPGSTKDEVDKKREKLDKKLKPILDKAQAMQELSDYCRTIKKKS